MRFLSKKCLIKISRASILACIMLAISIVTFLMCANALNKTNSNLNEIEFSKVNDSNCNLMRTGCFQTHKSSPQQAGTVFNIYYGDKSWVFKAKDFELSSDIFSLDARINNYNRNGTRQEKIELLNKLIDINIEPKIAFNYIYSGFNKKINIIKKNVEKPSKNAEIKLINNNLKIYSEIIGVKFDENIFYKNLINLYKNNSIINLEIPIIKQRPNIAKKDLQKEVCKRSEFSTSIASSNSSRKHNIKKAMTMINGTKLVKGERFSFNKLVGRRNAQNGFKQAKIILDGEFVDGIGGGVCQVSSTIYNAALLAGLDIVSSHKHSQRVGYVALGFDAMVNYGTSDLVFENNTGGNLYILCKYTPEKITVSIYGYDLNGVRYGVENEVMDKVSPKADKILHDKDGKYLDKIQYSDESFVLKKSREGYTVKSYRLKYLNNNLVERELLRVDKYPAQQGEVVYGVKERPINETSFVLSGLPNS